MENIISLENINKIANNIDIDHKVDIDLVKNRNEFTNVVQNVIDKGANYVIRGMPINNHIKNILIDVKESLKSKDFKEIVKTAVNSSIREGLDILSLPKNVIRDINRIKDISLQGGLTNGLTAGIDIISKKYLGVNLYSDYIKDFFSKIREFILSNEFIKKIGRGIEKCVKKIQDFKSICSEWYQAYDKFDLKSINTIASYLNHHKKKVNFNDECLEKNEVIQNMTKLINHKKDKLSDMQMQICSQL